MISPEFETIKLQSNYVQIVAHVTCSLGKTAHISLIECFLPHPQKYTQQSLGPCPALTV